MCVRMWVDRQEEGRSGYSTKNKNPTRQCGEYLTTICYMAGDNLNNWTSDSGPLSVHIPHPYPCHFSRHQETSY